MSSDLDIVRTFLDKAWANPPSSLAEANAAALADDFHSFDEQGNAVMDKQAYIGMGQMMYSAFNDFRWVLKDLQEGDGGVLMTGHFEGTHTGDFDLSVMGAGVFPASGKKIVWPEVTVKWRVVDGKIASEQPFAGETGMAAFIAAIAGA